MGAQSKDSINLYSSSTCHSVGSGSGSTATLSQANRGQCLPRRSCHSVRNCMRAAVAASALCKLKRHWCNAHGNDRSSLGSHRGIGTKQDAVEEIRSTRHGTVTFVQWR